MINDAFGLGAATAVQTATTSPAAHSAAPAAAVKHAAVSVDRGPT